MMTISMHKWTGQQLEKSMKEMVRKKKMPSPKEEALYVVAGLKIFQNPQVFTSAHYISPFQHHAKQFFLSPLQNIKFHINHW